MNQKMSKESTYTLFSLRKFNLIMVEIEYCVYFQQTPISIYTYSIDIFTMGEKLKYNFNHNASYNSFSYPITALVRHDKTK